MRSLPILIVLFGLGAFAFADSPEQKLAFKQAHEVLEKHCLECHRSRGEDAKAKRPKGRLALDSIEAMLKGGKSGPAIVQGHADQSTLVDRINRDKKAKGHMPKRGELNAAEKITLTQWIDGGALWFDELLGEDGEATMEEMMMEEMAMEEMHADLGVEIGGVSEEDAAFFKEHIESLFVSHCTGCHGGQKQKGGLRLDNRTMALRGGDTGPLVVPGNAAKSELYIRLTLPLDDDELMPPSEKPRIAEARIARVKEWIDRGAPWPKPKSKLDRGGDNHFTLFAAALSEDDKKAVESLREVGVFIEPLNWKGGGLRVVASFARSFDTEQIDALARFADQIYWADFTRVKWNPNTKGLLGKLDNLVILHVERSDFDDATFENLPSLPRLDYLNLHSTKITDTTLKSLGQKFPALTKLYLWNTKVSEGAIASLQKQRPNLKIVR